MTVTEQTGDPHLTTDILSKVVGKTVTKISRGEESLKLEFDDGCWLSMRHFEDCCETVQIKQIDGDLEDLVGEPLWLAECAVNDSGYGDPGTWSFYRFATVKGYVTVSWLGQSNGYYSETVWVEFSDRMTTSEGDNE